MIVEYVRYELKTHAPESLVEAYTQAAEHLRAAPECLGYELTRCEESPASLVLRIVWESSEAHTGGFRKGPHFPPFLALVRPFIAEIAEMRHYVKTPVEWSRS